MRRYPCIIIGFLFLAGTGPAAKAQDTLAGKPLPLAPVILQHQPEYSSLARCGRQLLLMPQYPDTHAAWLIDTADIGRVVDGADTLLGGKPLVVHHLDAVIARINASSPGSYEGVEATAVIGRTIYLSIETGDSNRLCYIVKGTLRDTSIEVDASRLLPLTKPRRRTATGTTFIANAGFESMTYLPATRQLLAVFEYNRAYTDRPTAYTFAPSLSAASVRPVRVDSVNFRITDLQTAGPQLLAINFLYKGDTGIYVHGIPVVEEQAMPGISEGQQCFCRILSMQKSGQRLHWRTAHALSYDCINWEGLYPFRKGVLVINDANKEKPSSGHNQHTQFRYYALEP